jgi:hypothetical protein
LSLQHFPVQTADRAEPNVRVIERRILAVLGLASLLAGCMPGSVIDQLPEAIGLPRDAPVRPTVPYDYPAVHDMPPPRPTQPLTEEEQVKLEKDLLKIRNQQEGKSPLSKKTAPPAKFRPPADIPGAGGGVKPNS